MIYHLYSSSDTRRLLSDTELLLGSVKRMLMNVVVFIEKATSRTSVVKAFEDPNEAVLAARKMNQTTPLVDLYRGCYAVRKVFWSIDQFDSLKLVRAALQAISELEKSSEVIAKESASKIRAIVREASIAGFGLDATDNELVAFIKSESGSWI